ncbi:MAG: AI-2E family transporter, partial [SAR324 cluster bacterium]|nr:AI-2E family transporter [SAR324 cluster bacterium]
MEISVLLKNSRFLLLLLLAVLVFGALYVFRAVMLPFAVAGLFAYLIAPLINRIATVRVRGRKVHRAIAIMLVYAVALSLLTLSGFFLVPKLTSEVNRLVKDLPRIMRDLEVSVVMPLDQKVGDWLKEFVPLPVPSEGTAAPEPNPPADGKTMESPPSGSDTSMLRLVEDYTYVVQQLDEGRFEITAKRRGEQIQEQQEPDWDVSKQISATFGQFRTYFEQNFVELLQLSRRYILIVVSSFFSTFLVLMTSAFILINPERIINFLRSLVPVR